MPPKEPKKTPLRGECQTNFYLPDGKTYAAGSVVDETQMSEIAWAGFVEDGRLVPTEKPIGRVSPDTETRLAPLEGEG